jgi:formylmethanofuran dehydrogenase subunit C
VTDDLMVSAGTIFVNGDVGDDVRIGGGTIYVNGNIKGDFLSEADGCSSLQGDS